VLQDKSNTVLWSTTSACRGNPTCYTYAMQNDGQLVVKDGDGAVIWTSAEETGSSSAKNSGWTYSITSNGRPGVSCIHSGPTPNAVYMASQSKAYKLQIAQGNAALSLVGADGSMVWGPSGAKSGSAPARLCITASGVLELSGSGGSSKLWSSSYATAGTKSGSYYAGQCGDAKLHSCAKPSRQPVFPLPVA
jgi:hypothetical protein